ncbi:exosortase U [Planctomycetaceae bacterium SH139]
MSAITESEGHAAVRPQAGSIGASIFAEPEKFWRLFWGLALVSCLPFVIPYARTLWRQELYQYFPFVWLAVGYLFWLRWDRVFRGPSKTLAWASLAFGSGFLALGAGMHSTWFGNLGFVLITTSLLMSQRSLRAGSLGYLALPLIMLIRIPQLHAQSLVSRLQKVTSQLGSLLLDIVGVPNFLQGNVLNLPTKELFVAEACSGIQSAFTMCFLALLIIVWRRRAFLLVPLYVVAALVLAIVANTFRISIIALAEAWYQYDLTTGVAHDLIGYISLALGAGILLSFDVLVGLFAHPVFVPVNENGANPFGATWNWVFGFNATTYRDSGYGWQMEEEEQADYVDEEETPLADDRGKEIAAPWRPMIFAGISCVAALVMLGGLLVGRSDSRPIIAQDELLFDPPSDLLKDRVGILSIGDHTIVRNGSEPRLGTHADLWSCGTNTEVVMSQPYVGWHELCVCYEAKDWLLEDRYNLNVKVGKPIAVGEFSQGESLYGYLLFTAIDSDGTVPNPPSYTLFGRLLAPFGPLVTDDFAETSGSAQTVMLQLWTISRTPLEPAEVGELAAAVSEIREKARQQILQQQQALASSGT